MLDKEFSKKKADSLEKVSEKSVKIEVNDLKSDEQKESVSKIDSINAIVNSS